ncbi:sigma factor-like helix-turn-helix DNA-binding protein [Polyangium sorediatum]|uniref:Sigma factor n=1 Tax=Polyangium sorediatum TaxID=889274 RepID=A0ABT6NTI0_9BACT|nr:sigma factor-like helix-turn-helix DNA-binding protein [Polyangium sorediatum]MDI1431618.1 sigma factor [Polyangium sorediatum]
MSHVPSPRDAILALRPFVVLWMRAFGHQPADAEDLAQKVIAAATASADAHDPTRATVKSWVYGFAVRLSKNHKRELRRHGEIFDESHGESFSAPSPSPTPEDIVASRSVHAFVLARLEGMRPELLDVLLACDMNGLSEEEAAVAFDIPKGTVKSRRSRAREQAYARLKDYRDELHAVFPALLVASEMQKEGGLWASVTAVLLAAAGASAATWVLVHAEPPMVAVSSSPRLFVSVVAGSPCEGPPSRVPPAPVRVCDEPTSVSRPRAMVEAVERAVMQGNVQAARSALERYLRAYPADPIRARSMFGWLLTG